MKYFKFIFIISFLLSSVFGYSQTDNLRKDIENLVKSKKAKESEEINEKIIAEITKLAWDYFVK